MNGRINAVISILILLVSIFALYYIIKQEPPKTKVLEKEVKVIDQDYNLLSFTRDLNKGDVINSNDVVVEIVKDKEGKDWGDKIVDIGKDFVVDSLVLRDVAKGENIYKSLIARPGSKEYDEFRAIPNNGFFPYHFALDDTGYAVLQRLKPNDKVDIYFKYETKNDKNVSLLPKREKNQNFQSEGTASSTNLLLLFENKRVLFLEKVTPVVKTVSEDLSQEYIDSLPKDNTVAKINIELARNEIKEIYTIDNLGDFVILPSVATSSKSNNSIATENILTKDFIKELRGGGEGDKSE